MNVLQKKCSIHSIEIKKKEIYADRIECWYLEVRYDCYLVRVCREQLNELEIIDHNCILEFEQ